MPARLPQLPQRLLALICVFFVFAFGLANLKSDPIENDEFRSLNHIEPVWLGAARSIPETIESVASLSPQHGPLFFIALNIWYDLVGADLFSLRLLSTLFATLSIAMAYRVASVTGAREDGLAAAIALSFLAFYMFFAHYLRMYSMLALAGGWLLWSYWRLTSLPRPSAWAWLSLLLATAVIPYTHYFGSIIPAAIVIYHIVMRRRDRRWWQVLLAMALAGVCFLPWLPVVLGGLAEHVDDASAVRMGLIEAGRAVLSVSSNGLLLLAPFVAGLAIVNRQRLPAGAKFLGLVTLLALVLLALLNVFAPIFIANRMRYTVVLALPFCCFAAICLRSLPHWKAWRWLALVLWCSSFFVYLQSGDYAVFTNIAQHETEKIPNYQEFVYQAEALPGHNELILSFHPNMRLSSNKTLPYYRKLLPRWDYIVHITYNDDGELLVQSGHSRYDSLDAIAANSRSIWLLHNPAQTDLAAMPAYSDWFLRHFKLCKRFYESEFTVIDYTVSQAIPCELITAAAPFTVHYDNGMLLANAHSQLSGDQLSAHLWWHETIGDDFSVSLQIFDAAGDKHRQLDAVVAGEPIDAFAFDLAGLPPGDYRLELIVYDFETHESVPGTIMSSQSRFPRSLALLEFSLDESA